MKERLPILLAGLGVSLLFAWLHLYKPTFLIFLENKTYDILLQSTATKVEEQGPVIVDLDEKSLNQLGQWPWPRYRVAQLLEKIHNLGAASVGIDIIFAEPDQTSPKQLQAAMQREFKVSFDFMGLPTEFQDNDLLLAQTLKKGPYTLGYQLTMGTVGNGTHCLTQPQPTIFASNIQTEKPSTFFKADGAVCTIQGLTQAAPSSGFINILSDIDGVIRRAPLLMEHQGSYYPSLALASLLQAQGEEQVIIDQSDAGIKSIRIKDRIIPTDPYGNLLINYYAENGAVSYISAVDIIEDRVSEEQISGRVVFVGTTATGLKDLRVTPLDVNFPGVAIHATIVDNIQKGNLIERPYSIITFELLSILSWGFLSTILLVYSRAGLSLVLLLTLSGGMWFGAEWAVRNLGIVALPTLTILTQFVNFSLLTFVKYWQEELKLKAQTKALVQAQTGSIRGLASLAETRDPETGAHILRTQHYVKALGKHLQSHPKFRKFLTNETIERLYKMAPLHDIGKVGVPDRILLKPDRLTPDEFEEMKRHTTYGYETLEALEKELGANPFLHIAKQIAHTHQEKWDGSGYPQGLKEEEIPVAGRLMALADVYDALISRRVYKDPMAHEEAVEIILKGRGSHFDPDITDAFLDIHETFRSIADDYHDTVMGESAEHIATSIGYADKEQQLL